MTLREALDMLELNERTLEQSMLDVALHNRLEHTELRHVMRVFEAYRKVNAFLNPSLNTQGDARVTIIDESVPGMATMEFSKAAAPDHWGSSDTNIASGIAPSVPSSQLANLNPRDSFSDHLIETSAVETSIIEPSERDFVVYPTEMRLPSTADRRGGSGISAIALMGLGALAFAAGVLVIGPLLGRVMPPRAPTVTTTPVASSPVPPTINPVAPPATVTPPAPVSVAQTPQPSITPPATTPPVAPTPPRASSPAPSAEPPATISPSTAQVPAAKPPVATPPAATSPVAKPPVAVSPPRAAATPAMPRPVRSQISAPTTSTPRVLASRVVTPRATPRRVVPRASIAPVTTARRAVTRPTRVVTPAPRVAPIVSQRVLNERQFASWDRRGAVLRYRSWSLVPSAVRALSAAKFRAAVFVASNPAAMPDLPR
jgi:hypothetical protein